MEEKLEFITTKLSRLKKVVAAAEAMQQDEEDVDIALEYVLASCFPNVWQNIMGMIQSERTKAYIEGVNDTKEKYKIDK